MFAMQDFALPEVSSTSKRMYLHILVRMILGIQIGINLSFAAPLPCYDLKIRQIGQNHLGNSKEHLCINCVITQNQNFG